jgi:hypothetical protein
MGPRSRFTGKSGEVVEIVLPYVTSVTWLRYGPKIDERMLMKYSKMIAELKYLQPNLSFTKKFMLDVFSVIRDKPLVKDFPFQGTERDDWAEVMQSRLRLMLRHAQQALVKDQCSVWASSIRGHLATIEGKARDEEEVEEEGNEEDEEEEKAGLKLSDYEEVESEGEDGEEEEEETEGAGPTETAQSLARCTAMQSTAPTSSRAKGRSASSSVSKDRHRHTLAHQCCCNY